MTFARRNPKPRKRFGFTLIELLLVVSLIGILASLVLPRFNDAKTKAYVAAIKNDLRNLAIAQELHFDTNDAYASSATAAALNWDPSPGVIVTMGAVSTASWSATARHAKSGTLTCTISVTATASNTITGC